jgi:hypothetical protein
LYVLTISIIKGISNHQAVPLLLKIFLIWRSISFSIASHFLLFWTSFDWWYPQMPASHLIVC